MNMNHFFKMLLVVLGLAAAPLLAQANAGPLGMGFPAQAKEKLNLNPAQQAQWDVAQQQTRAARDTMKQAHQQLKQATEAELAKPEPDLAALAAVADNAQANNQQARHAARAEWLKLYASLDSTQKATVRDYMLKGIERMQAFRARVREHFAD
jgi:hypothetical protein